MHSRSEGRLQFLTKYAESASAHTGLAVLPCGACTTLQREFWDGHPVVLGTGFELRKRKSDSDEVLDVCEQWRAVMVEAGRRE